MGDGKFPALKPDVVTADITNRFHSSPIILWLEPLLSEKPLFSVYNITTMLLFHLPSFFILINNHFTI